MGSPFFSLKGITLLSLDNIFGIIYNPLIMKQENDKLKNIMDSNWAWFLFSFKGRISRKPYWMFNLIVFVAGMILGLATGIENQAIGEFTQPQLMFMIWIFWPSLAVQAKRWHDNNKPAWWLLINVVPIIGPLWALIENGFIAGTPGENRYGPDPLKHKEVDIHV